MEKCIFCCPFVEAQAKRHPRLIVQNQSLNPTCRTRNVEVEAQKEQHRKDGPESVDFGRYLGTCRITAADVRNEGCPPRRTTKLEAMYYNQLHSTLSEDTSENQA